MSGERFHWPALLWSLVLLAGCTLGPDYSRPRPPIPEQYSEPARTSGDVANLPWWEVFTDEALRKIVSTALAENKDLAIAAERVEAARALLGFTRADLFPRLDISGQAQRFDISDESLSFFARPRNDFGIFADLSYELDIWGRLRRATEAQRSELLASEYGRRAVTVSLVSDVASTYLRIAGLEDRLAVADRTYRNRRSATKIIDARFRKGMIPELDLNQAQIEEAGAAITANALERELRQARNALTVLLGGVVPELDRPAGLARIGLRADIPAGFPAALLERRPDVLAAEEQARATVERIGVAMADQLPRLDLLGTIGLQSSETSRLFDRRAFTWSIGGSLLGPLVDWGKSASLVEVSEAESRAAMRNYELTVLRSVQEVEDALSAIRTFRKERDHRMSQLRASGNAARLSRARYDDGVTSYLEVLDIERSLFQAELGASEAQEGYLVSVVGLYEALGGGWIDPFADEHGSQPGPGQHEPMGELAEETKL